MERFFNILLLGDARIQTCLNAIIYLANSNEKEQAHITFQGPFEKVGDAHKAILGLDARSSVIRFNGVGSFINERQSTVYLNVECDFVRRHWKKAAGFDTPHLTIYDGKSRSFAESLLEALSKFRLQFEVPAGSIETAQSVSGQSRLFLALNLDQAEFEAVSGMQFSHFLKRASDEWFRLMVIERLCSRLESIAYDAYMEKFKRRALGRSSVRIAE